jgi:hypothetical protein
MVKWRHHVTPCAKALSPDPLNIIREYSINKLIISIVVALVLIIGGATLFLNRLDGIIADMIESTGSEVLGTRVTVDQVTTSINNGTASVSGLTIANPPGYTDSLALDIPEIIAEVNYASQTIKSIEIESPNINAELIGSKNNFQALLKQMPGADEGEDAAAEGKPLTLTIESLTLRQAIINLRITKPEMGQREFKMDDFVMSNLSGTVDELSDQILAGLASHISSQVSRYARAELTRKATEVLTDEIKEKLSEKLKGFGLN